MSVRLSSLIEEGEEEEGVDAGKAAGVVHGAIVTLACLAGLVEEDQKTGTKGKISYLGVSNVLVNGAIAAFGALSVINVPKQTKPLV